MSVVILVIDQLAAAMLGPYGNTTVETTNFNRLASQSLLFDFAFANAMELEKSYQALWSPVLSTELSLDSMGLAGRLAEGGIDSILITDDPTVSAHSLADFDRVIVVAQEDAERMAQKSSETQLANFFAQATAWLSTELEPGQLVWLHSRGLAGAWDAPYDWRTQFADDDDPDPPTFVRPPAVWIDPNELDPDQVLGWQQAAAAQVLLIDEFLGVLLDVLDSSPEGKSVLFAMTSTRGCGLGEHGLVGAGSQLYGESVQVPLMIRFPEVSRLRTNGVGRSGSLVQINRLSELIEFWLSDDTASVEQVLTAIDQVLPVKNSECILISSNEQDSLQTHAWKLVRSKMGGVELFAKPDDRCEVNDVSNRCPEVVEKMLVLLDAMLSGGEFRLPDELVLRED